MLTLDEEVADAPVAPSAEALWLQWTSSRSSQLRSALFLHYSQWLRTVTAGLLTKYRYPLAEWSDYINCASIGLLAAIDNYDPGFGVPFEAYAYPRVKGATLNGLAVYVSESRKNVEPADAAMHHTSRLNDDYDNDDPLTNVIDAVVDLALGRFLELGVTVSEEVDNSPQSHYETETSIDFLHRLLEQLPERECFVLTSHYLHQMEFQIIAEVLQVSAPRVTQLHQQALRRLRKLYELIC